MFSRWHIGLALCVAVITPVVAQDSNQGVSRDEIVIGSILDMSGPAANYGKQLQQGMLLRVGEINEQGGIHGRKLRLVVEDSAYDPKKSVLAAQKLVNNDRVFAMVGLFGAAANVAAFPVLKERQIPNLFPNAAARSMFEPYDRLKFAYFPTYDAQLREPLGNLVQSKRISRACILYQDDEFGLDVVRSGEAALKPLGMKFLEVTSYKRGATDFSSQVARLKSSNCELVLLGTLIRETVATMAEARRTGFQAVFLATYGVYSEQVPNLGGRAVDGLYVAHVAQHPYLDDASASVRFWATKYKTKFLDDPTVLSVYGYEMIDIFVAAAGKAGRNLGTTAFIEALDTLDVPPSPFGTSAISFRKNKRVGSDTARLSQLRDGRWVVITAK